MSHKTFDAVIYNLWVPTLGNHKRNWGNTELEKRVSRVPRHPTFLRYFAIVNLLAFFFNTLYTLYTQGLLIMFIYLTAFPQIDQSQLRKTRSAENMNFPPQIVINQVKDTLHAVEAGVDTD